MGTKKTIVDRALGGGTWLDEKRKDPEFEREFQKGALELAHSECRLANEECARLRAALATARKERDDARRMYCIATEILCGWKDQCCGTGPMRAEDVAHKTWPADADRLFPKRG